MRTLLITSEDEFSSLEVPWKALFKSLPQARITQSWEWNFAWWQCIGCHYGKLRLITLWDEEKLIATLPLYRAKRSWLNPRIIRLFSTGEENQDSTYGELCNPLMDQAHGQEGASFLEKALLTLLGKEADVVLFERVSVDTFPVLHQYSRADTILPSFYAELSGGFDTYVQSLGRSRREQARKLLRTPNLSYRIISSPEEAQEVFSRMVILHQKRWEKVGEPGSFRSDRVLQFHQKLRELLPLGEALILFEVQIQSQSACILYGFRHNELFEFYQGGVAPGSEEEGGVACKSPGILGHLLLMRKLSEEGVALYDFLGGEGEYKRRFSTHEVALHSIQYYGHSWRNILRSTARLVKRVVTG